MPATCCIDCGGLREPLGADDLTAAAERLERALATDGPIDAELRAGFLARAADTLAVISRLETAVAAESTGGGA